MVSLGIWLPISVTSSEPLVVNSEGVEYALEPPMFNAATRQKYDVFLGNESSTTTVSVVMVSSAIELFPKSS